MMVGKGENIKSIAYVENVAAFLEHCLSFDPGLHIYNYVDKPDLDMNTLVCKVRELIKGKSSVGIRLPGFLGLVLGRVADVFSNILGITLPVSAIRVRKFMGTTQFKSSVDDTGFVAPISLEDGLTRTIRYEFLEDNSHEQTFNTE